MDTFRIEKTIPKSRAITISKLPFRAGEKVEIVVKPRKRARGSNKRYPLRGTVIQYTEPFEPVASSDWEAER